MTEIPSWVIYAAGLFFVLNSVLFIALIILSFKAYKLLEDLQPRIVRLEAKLQEVIAKVNDVASKVQDRVTNVGGKAQNVAGSLDLVAKGLTGQLERISPYVTAGLTVYRIIAAIRSGRKKRK